MNYEITKSIRAKMLLIIGISGVTCGGKTTLAKKLNEILPNCKVVSQDDYFLDVDDKRHVWISELNHINFDILSSLDMEKMYTDLIQLLQNKTILFKKKIGETYRNGTLSPSDQNLEKLVQDKIKTDNIEVLIVEGFCIFNYEPLLPFFSLKYYFTLSEKECFKRRQPRVYEPPDVPGYFEKCVWPEHLKQLEQVQNDVKDTTFFDESKKNPLELVLKEILTLLKS